MSGEGTKSGNTVNVNVAAGDSDLPRAPPRWDKLCAVVVRDCHPPPEDIARVRRSPPDEVAHGGADE
jgi:hypothetical protein